MVEALTTWMQGEYAGKTMLVLRIVFFALFVATTLFLVFPGRDSLRCASRKNGNLFFCIITVLALFGILLCQGRWQLFGARNADLVRFIRRHNARPSVDIRRGTILDRNGSVLAIDDPEGETPGKRRYPLGYAAAHLIGYYDPCFGIVGFEKLLDSTLFDITGTPLDDLQRLGRSIVESPPVEGRDVKLTIDARMQRSAQKALGEKTGAVVVLNGDTGEILSLFSSPGFDPLAPGDYYGDEKDAPFLNRPIQGRYPAGSTFKIVMALIAADLRLAPILDCPGEGFRAEKNATPIRDSEYYSYKRSGHVWKGFGKIGLKDALVHSSNVYFAQLALKIDPEAFNNYITLFGIREKQVLYKMANTGYTLAKGNIPVVSKNQRLERTQLAIGQGTMLVSPLHVAMWTSVVASKGTFIPPHLEYNPAPGTYEQHKVVSAYAADVVKSMMRQVVLHGTARDIDIPGLGVAGKTGTAQNPHGEDHSWFTCFTTQTTPKLVVTVLVENGGFGSKAALPATKRILEDALRFEIIKKVETE